VAFDEPGMMNEEVYFFVESDGYEHPADGFGFRGVRLRTVPGTEATVTVDRTMVAERIYRLTGAGIYRDSFLLGKDVPVKAPLLSGRVLGQDSVQGIVLRDRIFWLWGDTSRMEYPLGNFAASAATSTPPWLGGLSPSVGIEYDYFVDERGFSRGMVEVEGPGAKWLDGFMLVPDETGAERLIARCERVASISERYERMLVVWDESREVFVRYASYDFDTPLHPAGKPFQHTTDGLTHFYFPTPFPIVRVAATVDSIKDHSLYEAYTCLMEGSLDAQDESKIERDSTGRAVWGWKRNTAPLSPTRQMELLKNGSLTDEGTPVAIRDPESKELIILWGGTAAWNAYRQRWIVVAYQMFGKPSNLGEVWIAESPSVEGPWRTAHKIITHRKHTFYNPVHHDFLDEEEGRIIYVEGTYGDLFSNNAVRTPRYDYNQIMYRVDLSRLPSP
jgi:hypothetical protein